MFSKGKIEINKDNIWMYI